MYITCIEVYKVTQQGWDKYKDVYHVYTASDDKEESILLAEEWIQAKTDEAFEADFGIKLYSCEAKILYTEKVEG